LTGHFTRKARALLGLLLLIAPARAQQPPARESDQPAQKFVIGYLRRAETRTAISRLDLPAENDGQAGAQAGLDDNNVAGEFLGQDFSLVAHRLNPAEDPAQALADLEAVGARFILADLPAESLLQAADSPAGAGALLFNIGAPDENLREQSCRANIIHVAPSRAMLADGLTQYLLWKQWRKWLLVVGSHEEDRLWAEALKRSVARFGGKIVEERMFADAGGARHADSGVALVQKQIPAFTQNAPSHDVLVAADESAVFADYLPYRTWDARPVAGSAGLVPTAWDPSYEQAGATQLQQRFERKFMRPMSALDMNGWTAARMIGEAAAHDAAGDIASAKAHFLSKDFALAAFKGQKLTLRDWNLQLRQPILLSDGRNVVSVSPQEGFMHQFSELDTLGLDRPETKCQFK
jgi:ABC transporter substrate binding protein (PQQ-dependent alcohol dehydrogenase system)